MAVKTRKPGMSKGEPINLRGRGEADVLSDEATVLLGCFLAAAVVGEVGVYVKTLQRSGQITLKLYDGDDAYADLLRPAEITKELLDDYAKTLGFGAHYRAIVATVYERPA